MRPPGSVVEVGRKEQDRMGRGPIEGLERKRWERERSGGRLCTER